MKIRVSIKGYEYKSELSNTCIDEFQVEGEMTPSEFAESMNAVPSMLPVLKDIISNNSNNVIIAEKHNKEKSK